VGRRSSVFLSCVVGVDKFFSSTSAAGSRVVGAANDAHAIAATTGTAAADATTAADAGAGTAATTAAGATGAGTFIDGGIGNLVRYPKIHIGSVS